jgi:hypothetical protein
MTASRYPSKWEPQKSSGPLPMFLPESEAVAKGICARPNICSLLTYHTYGGEIRDPLAATDAHDLNAFAQLTAQGVAATGYRKVRSGIGGAFLQVRSGRIKPAFPHALPAHLLRPRRLPRLP